MDYNITRKEAYSFASIVRNKEEVAMVLITVDLHKKNAAHVEAVESMYTEALLSGCGRYDRKAFQEALGLLGASIDIYVEAGRLNISIQTIAVNVNEVLDLFSCMMTAPSFSPNEFKRLRTLRRNELHDKKENARVVSLEKFRNQLYGNNDRRYSHDSDELIAEIGKVTRKELLSLHANAMEGFWYCTAGGSEKTVRSIEHSIATIKTKYKPRDLGAHTQKLAAKNTVLTNIPSRHNIEFAIGSTLPFTLRHPDLPAFLFGLNVLGYPRGFSGRLMGTVREKEGLTYGIYARAETIGSDELGYWRIGTFFAPDKAEQGLRSTIREVKAMNERGISDSEFKRFRSILKTESTLLMDSITRALRELHWFHAENFTLEDIEGYKQKLMTVTRNKVNEAMAKYLNPSKLVVSGAGPVSSVEKQVSKLL